VFVLLLVLLIVVAVAAVAAAGSAAGSRPDRAERSLLGGTGPPLILLIGGLGAVVLLAALGLIVGVRGGPSPHDESPAAARPTVAAEPAKPEPPSVPAEKTPAAPMSPPHGAGPEVTIVAGGTSAVIDRLPDRAVLVVNARGFKPGTGVIAHCRVTPEEGEDCRNGFPVEFGGEGNARVQYLVSGELADGQQCGAGVRPCLLLVTGPDGESQGRAFTVFGEPAPPPGKVVADPPGRLADGDVVTLTGTGFPPDTRVLAAQCSGDVDLSPGECRPEESARTGSSGTVVLRLKIRTGEVEGVVCERREPCSIRVTADAPVAPVTLPVAFSAGPSARYDAVRVAGGLVLAALLLALGWHLLRTTDWGEPASASTPEMDQAVLDP
jgi:hypothetical protein